MNDVTCPACEGDGEVSHGSCSVPDCEHAEQCPCCGGSGKAPTPEEIATLRNRCAELEGDRMVTDAELVAYKERCAGGHPFDLARVEKERDEALGEIDRLRERQERHLELIRNLSQSTPLDDEVAQALAQRGVLLAEVGTLRAALRQIAEHPHNSYDLPSHAEVTNGDVQYAIGIADGHRCAAAIAREALVTAPTADGNRRTR